MVPITRIPKNTNSVRFVSDNHVKTFSMASQFVGEKGRIANATDIIKARLNYDINHEIWQDYFVTSSTEWIGLNKNNQLVLAVLHEESPLEDIHILETNYKYQRDKPIFNLVDRSLFLDILDGSWGAVTIIPFKDILEMENRIPNQYKFMEMQQAINNKLLLARLGTEDNKLIKKYLSRHEIESIQLNRKINAYNTLAKTFIRSKIGRYYPLRVLQNKKLSIDPALGSNHGIDLTEMAFAHFIVLKGLEKFNDEFHTTTIGISEVNKNVSMIGILDKSKDIFFQKDSSKICTYHSRNLYKAPQKLIIDNILDKSQELDFYHIKEFDKYYYTFRDDGSPEHLVRGMKILSTRTIKIKELNGKIDKDQVLKVANNSHCNSYRIINIDNSSNSYFKVKIDCLNIEVETHKIVATEKQLISDPKLLGRIV